MSEVSQVPLAHIATERGLVGGPFGSSLVSADYQRDGVPVLRGENLSHGRWTDGPFVYVSPEKVEQDLKRNTTVPGDVVFTQRGTLGQVSLVTSDYPSYVISQSQMRLRVDREIADPMYVYYASTGPAFLHQLNSHVIIGGVPHINLGILGRLKVPLPSLAEQRAIAATLGALDDKIDSNRQTGDTVITLARVYYGKLQSNPWPQHLLSSTVEVLSGGTPKTNLAEYWGGNIPWYSVVDAPSGTNPWILATSRTITEDGLSHSAAQILPRGTTIISARGTVGKLALLGVPMAINQSCYGLRSKVGRRGIFTYFSAQDVVDELKRGAHGSVFDTITRESLASVSIAVPERPQIEKFEETVGPLFDKARQLIAENVVLATLRDTLVVELLSGHPRLSVEDTPNLPEATMSRVTRKGQEPKSL